MLASERLQSLLGGDALASLRQRLRRRYANGGEPPDGFTLSPVSGAEREALAGLLGRSRKPAASMRLSHREIDAALQRAQLAPDLRSALETLDGPIIDHNARRAREHQLWQTLFGNVPPGPLAQAFEDVNFQGVVKRLASGNPATAERILQDAQRLLTRLPASGVSRSQLAAELLGDAHGLDNNRPVTTLLRRVLNPGRTLERMRDVWAIQGVLVNELAKPALTLNLGATGDGPTDRLLQTAASAGEPLHLSLRALLRHRPCWRESQTVFVCENPDIVAAAADAIGADCPPMVSLDGQLSAAPRTLLDQLHAAGSALCYHGDFDWAGLRIANGIIARYRAAPWRYSAADYATPTQGPALGEDAVEAAWDEGLTAKMHKAGLAVHEEAQLPELLNDLKRFAQASGNISQA